jgi:putative PIN family toxin of toxin-antitoxin system
VTRPIQIVLDTNVLVAALRSRLGVASKLLTMLNDPRWQVNISTTLILEYEDVLKRPGMVPVSPAAIDILLDGLCSIANQQAIFFLWRPTSSDPKDDFLLELAFCSQADFIITYNARDLRAAAELGIKVVTPREFLRQMGELQ